MGHAFEVQVLEDFANSASTFKRLILLFMELKRNLSGSIFSSHDRIFDQFSMSGFKRSSGSSGGCYEALFYYGPRNWAGKLFSVVLTFTTAATMAAMRTLSGENPHIHS